MQYFAVLAPTVGVALIFYYVIRAIVRADRNERAALERFEAEERRLGEAYDEQDAVPADPANGAGSDRS